jgi:tetratricopeptide (TPR) repeat protein
MQLNSFIDAMGRDHLPLRHGELTAAGEAASQVINTIKPSNHTILAWAYSLYGTVQHLQGNYSAAYDALNEALTRNPRNADTLYNIACCSARLGRSEEAINYLRSAVLMRPSFAAMASVDSDLEALRQNAAFQAVISSGQNP